MRWDEDDPIVLTRAISAGSASAALGALGSGMLAFTGFVTSIVLLIIQFGTSEFSPRFLGWFRTNPTLKSALSTFIATFLFALVSTAQMGRGTATFVPTRTLIAALLLTLLSIAMFLLLIDRTSYRLRVAAVLQRLDSDARAVFDIVYPSSASQAVAAEEAARSLRGRPAVQTVHNSPVGSVLVAIDRPRLVNLAKPPRRDRACARGLHPGHPTQSGETRREGHTAGEARAPRSTRPPRADVPRARSRFGPHAIGTEWFIAVSSKIQKEER